MKLGPAPIGWSPGAYGRLHAAGPHDTRNRDPHDTPQHHPPSSRPVLAAASLECHLRGSRERTTDTRVYPLSVVEPTATAPRPSDSTPCKSSFKWAGFNSPIMRRLFT